MSSAAVKMKAPDVFSADKFDVKAIREQFPILHQKVYGRDLVYLDNAASTQKPLAVTNALTHYYATSHANVHRGVHALSDRATEAFENARAHARHFVNARHAREIIFVRGATEGLNLVASSYGRYRLKPGDEILVSEMEHHSNIVPWQLIAEQTGSAVRMIPMDDRGEIIQDEYQNLLNEKNRGRCDHLRGKFSWHRQSNSADDGTGP